MTHPHIRIRKFDNAGNLINVSEVLAQLGFKVGTSVIRKDKFMATITNIKGEWVHLSEGDKKVSYKSFLANEWSTYRPVKEQVKVTNLLAMNPLLNEQGNIQTMKARIYLELRAAFLKSKYLDNMEIGTKPKGLIVGEKPIPQGKLVLWPYTTNISVKKPGEQSSVYAQVGECVKGWHFGLGPLLFTEENRSAVPFWYVLVTHDPKEANMAVVDENCTVYSETKDALDIKVKLPTMQNVKGLEPGDELVVFRPKKQKSTFLEPLVPTKRIRTKQQ